MPARALELVFHSHAGTAVAKLDHFHQRVRLGLYLSVAIVVVMLAFVAQEVLTRWTQINSHFLLLYPAVFVAAWLGGLWPGIVATTGAALAGWYFSVPATSALTELLPGDAAELAIFCMMGVGFSIASFRRQRTRHAMNTARAASLDAEARLRILVRNAPVGLWAVDTDGIFVLVETGGLPAALNLGCYGVGQNIFCNGGAEPAVIDAVRRALQGENVNIELQSVDRWYMTHFSPLADSVGGVAGVVAVTTDITERKELEVSKQNVIDALRSERDLRELFVSALTHDLRTPLQAARMGAELLVRQAKDPIRVVTLSGRIMSHMDRMSSMIQNLLEAHRLDAGEPLPLDLHECELRALVQDVVDELNTLYGDRYCLSATGSAKGYWDVELLRRVLENLASNAIKYGASGKQVSVALDDLSDAVSLSVHNEGEAISPDEQTRLFERFNRGTAATARKQPGWGIGLSFVRSVAEAHGGQVSVRSEPGLGTTFRVTLPKDVRAQPQQEMY